MQRLRRWLHLIVPLAMIALAVIVRTQVPEVEEAQLEIFDIFQRIEPRAYEPVAVRIVDIDNQSLRDYGQWPWPRTYIAQLVANLFEAGAGTVVFDIVFAEPDRTSPQQVLQVWAPFTPGIEERLDLTDLPDHDAFFADFVAQVPVVLGFVFTDGTFQRRPPLKGSFAFTGDDPRQFLTPYSGAVLNLEALEDATTGLGNFNIEQETDGIIRRVPLLWRALGQVEEGGETHVVDELYPSLTAEALRVVQGAKTFIVKSSGASSEQAFGESTGITHVKIGRIEIPTDSQGRVWMHDTGPIPERFVGAGAVLSGEFDPSLIEGHIVLIGTSAPGLLDIRSTPLNPAAPGVEVHAQILEQVLLKSYLDRPDWGDGAEVLYLIALGVALTLLLPLLGALWCALLGAAAVAAAVGMSWYSFIEFKLLLDPVFPSLVVLVVYLAGSLINYLRSEAERRQVRGAFSRYMSPALVAQLANDPSRLVLGGEMKDMTLLFADIRGFTTISEQFKADPQGLTRLINRFLTPMTDTILSRRGTIDKYMGDAIMAFWNAPLDDSEHAQHACQSALEMFNALEGLNADIKAEREAAGEQFFPLNIGIGLNSGECCVGNMGSDQRFDYSVLGDTVNLAARLEGQTKTYGVGIVIGDTTKAAVPDYATLELDYIAVKGKTEGVYVHALLGDKEMKESQQFQLLEERHQAMLEAYRQREFGAAATLIKECRLLDGALGDLYDIYDERLSEYVANPPPPEWDGVYVATSK